MQYSEQFASAQTAPPAGSRRRVRGRARRCAIAPHTASVLAADRGDAALAQAEPARRRRRTGRSPTRQRAAPPADSPTRRRQPRQGNADGAGRRRRTTRTPTMPTRTPKRDRRVGNHGIVIDKGGKRIRIEGLGRDREYDSFEQFVQDAPWLAGLVFLVGAARVPRAAADHRAADLVQDAQEPHGERDDAEARRTRRRAAGRRRWTPSRRATPRRSPRPTAPPAGHARLRAGALRCIGAPSGPTCARASS